MAMRTQRRTIIDPMYIEDADVRKVLRIIRGAWNSDIYVAVNDPCPPLKSRAGLGRRST